ncbi:hypothetical protein HPP92_001155 [Vanilla planifolia]|uniref:Wound-responsive family protein n=1 Tax=Vanilla planifolia TaxID=51239 RepID=A0A835VLA4_VANPL|nr:hypothetical protein HPP92_001155 [Vanilla planifolia]
MASASKKGVSLLVAASVGAVESLKDQMGLCRWNYALRSVVLHANAMLPRRAARLLTADEEAVRRRKLAEKAVHLVCWGPN